MQEKKGCGAGIFIVLAIGIVLFIFFKPLFWVALGIVGVAVLALIVMLINMDAKQKAMKREKVIGGTTRGDIEGYVAVCEKQMQEIRRHLYDLKDSDMREELDTIATLSVKLFREVKDDPNDFKEVRRFFNYMLPALKRIVNNVMVLHQSGHQNAESKQAMLNAKEGLTLLRKATEAQIAKCQENNILDLDVELSVLKKSLAARGLIEDDGMKGEQDD